VGLMARKKTQSAKIKSDTKLSYTENRSVPSYVLYLLVVGLVVAIGVSFFSLKGYSDLKKTIEPVSIDLDKFLGMVTAHTELESFKDVSPTNILQVNNNNLASLQGQIQGLNINHIGKFLIQYSDRIVLFDYENDIVEGQIPLEQAPTLPEDFLGKLYAHTEISSLQGENPVGGVLDSGSLNTLKEQFPSVYENAKEGDYLLRYPTALVIYDYGNDQLVNAVPLEQG
tara:strand:+ start:19036 stop:19716 length:681 start_codon:yes stop_codon:yes gene_type:complete